jgi:predicted phosphodiesterase
MPYHEETLIKAKKLADECGFDAAAEQLGIKKETLRRYVRKWKRINEESEPPIDDNLMRQMRDRFSDSELRRMVNGSFVSPDHTTVHHDFDGKEVCFGAITDTHLGSVYTDPEMVYQAFEVFEREGVDFIVHCGDVHEGLSHRAGHMYECSHIGYSAQLEHSREVFGQWTDTPIYIIDGNHDRWYIKSNGALIVDELCRGQENLKFLGHDEGNIDVAGVNIKLWHGEDGSSYALSYRVQKIVESFTGGEKPNILVCGHTHKAFNLYDRHVHCISAGAIQKQSRWMRSKRQASHTGFYTARFGVTKLGVSWIEPRFYPFYC